MTTEANPYGTTAAALSFVDEKSTPVPRFRLVIWLLAYLYPAWLAGSFYATWLVAWIQLGHRPRPMLDDPKSIGGLVDIAYMISGLLVMAMPLLTPIGFASSFFCPLRSVHGKRYSLVAGLAVLYVLLCVLSLLMLRADFGRAVEWWFD